MPLLKIVVVKMGGGWLKAILPHREESVFGCDEYQLSSRLKQIGIREPILTGIGGRKKAA